MQYSKKIALCLASSFIVATWSNCSENISDFPQENSNKFDDPALTEYLDSHKNDHQIFRVPSDELAQDIIDILLSINGIAILEENLLLRSAPFNKRNLVTNPILFNPQKLCYAYHWTLGGHIFYNQTSRTYFSGNCDNISSYLAITQEGLLEKISESLPKIQQLLPDFQINPIDILPLFKNGTCQERRAGFMFHADHQWSWGALHIIVPLYYLERNFFLTIEERDAIEKQLGTTSPQEQANFQKNHAVSDRFGFGDTRIDLSFIIKNCPDYTISSGIYTIIPTAITLFKGALGSSFENSCCRPSFSFQSLFAAPDGATPEQAKMSATTIAQNFILQALNAQSGNLLATGLGDGHFSLGAFARTNNALDLLIRRDWASAIVWRNYVGLQYTFPAKEKRRFIKNANAAEFAARDFTNESQAVANLAFLEAQLVDRIFPYCFDATIHPGFEFEWTSKFQYEGIRWGGLLGTDFWLRSREKIKNICGPKEVLDNVLVCRAEKPLAFQAQLLSSIFYKVCRPTRDWLLSLNGGYTFASSGIGRDFTLTLNLEVNF